MRRRIFSTMRGQVSGGGTPVSLIPPLTSNTWDGGSVSAVSEYSGRAAYRACDGLRAATSGDTATMVWTSNQQFTPWWWKVSFNTPKQVTLLRIYGHYQATNAGNRLPGDFRVEGSNDNIIWSTLFSISDLTASSYGDENSYLDFEIDNVSSYTRYRLYINITAGGSVMDYAELNEIELYGFD